MASPNFFFVSFLIAFTLSSLIVGLEARKPRYAQMSQAPEPVPNQPLPITSQSPQSSTTDVPVSHSHHHLAASKPLPISQAPQPLPTDLPIPQSHHHLQGIPTSAYSPPLPMSPRNSLPINSEPISNKFPSDSLPINSEPMFPSDSLPINSEPMSNQTPSDSLPINSEPISNLSPHDSHPTLIKSPIHP
ncbi:hypothetical protein ACFE04_023483 [Oxalis oulophora]